jgi:hypothetical protein
MPAAITFKETKLGFEIRRSSGTIMICNCGEGSKAFPMGTAQLTKMTGGDKILVIDPPHPLSDLFSDPRCLMPSDDSLYVWWIHPADYEPVVRMLKELGAAHGRAQPLRVGSYGRNSMGASLDQKSASKSGLKKRGLIKIDHSAPRGARDRRGRHRATGLQRTR